MTEAERADLDLGSARSLLLTVLGELVWPSGSPAWTSSLLAVMGGLGVEEGAARQAIARAAKSGWVEARRVGRETQWVLTPVLLRAFEEGTRRVASLSEPFLDWDGSWLVVLVTVPHDLRATRKRLYNRLNWAGFGNPTAGVWLSPHTERRDRIAETIAELGLTDSTMSFRGTTDAVGLTEQQIVDAGWDLSALAAHYASIDDEFARIRPTSSDEILFAHIRLLAALQSLPFSDPQLPEALLPDWIGRRVSAHLQTRRLAWSDAVHEQWDRINGEPSTAVLTTS